MTTDDVVARRLEDALIAARLARPYYARAIARCRVRVAPVGNVAIDQHWTVYVDPEWVDRPELGVVIGAHEVEHVLRAHFRRAMRVGAVGDPMWVHACNLEINDDASDLPTEASRPKDHGYPEGLLAEEYYARLRDDKHVMAPCPICAGGSGAGAPLPVESDPGPDPDEEDEDTFRDQVAADVRAYAAAHGRGSVPAGIWVWADARARTVEIPWPRRLAALVSRAGRETAGRQDWSDAVLRRRGGELVPTMIARRARATLIVDTSGSMAGAGDRVLGLVRAVMQRSLYDVTRVITCDAAITTTTRQRAPRAYRGGGGTDLRPALAVAARGTDLIVVVTDGDTPWPDAPPARPVVAVLTAIPSTPVPRWVVAVEAKP